MPAPQQNTPPVEGRVLHLYLKKLVWRGATGMPGVLSAPPRIHLDLSHGNSRIAGRDDCHEVWLRLRVAATMGGEALFSADIVQAGIFRLAQAKPTRLKELFTWCSGVLYAQALRILTTAMRNGGFEPISFHDRRFADSFLVDPGGRAINMGRLSRPGEILPALVHRPQAKENPVGAREKKSLAGRRKKSSATAWQGWLVAASLSLGCYLLGWQSGVFLAPAEVLAPVADLALFVRNRPQADMPQPRPSAVPAPVEAPLPAPPAPPADPVVPPQYVAVVEAGAVWFADQSAGQFTLQIGEFADLDGLADFTGGSRFDEPLRLVLLRKGDGSPSVYLGLLGAYPNEEAARVALRHLLDGNPGFAPQIRALAELQKSDYH